MIRKTFLIFLVIIFALINLTARAQDAAIMIDGSSNRGLVNKKIFGNNLLGYDPGSYRKNKKRYSGHSDYGAGIWDPDKRSPNIEVVHLAKEAGITVLRFPGGCGSHNYNWKEAIGGGRQQYLFGIDEFIKTAKVIGAEPVITVSYFVGNEQDAADLVEYLNSPDDGRHKWARARAENGHKMPFGVKYFEFDNETWHGNHLDLKNVNPEEYASRYLLYREKMKEVDSDIMLGAVLLNIGYKDKHWDKVVAGIVQDKADYFITHSYPPHFSNRKLHQKFGIKELFEISLAYPVTDDQEELDQINSLIKEVSGGNMAKLAVSEFNGYFVQNKPLPYRHCLGNALVNAQLIKSFMEPKNNILMANYWNLSNEFWGMISNGFKGSRDDLYKPYYKRPNYLVFEMYAKHFGEILINASVKGREYHSINGKIPYLSLNASRSMDGNKIFLIVINKNFGKKETAVIELIDFPAASKVNAWVLNGPGIEATNESDHEEVKIKHEQIEIGDDKFEYAFEPHSLTALEFIKKDNQ